MAPFSARQHIICLARYIYAITRPSVYLSVCLSIRHTGGSVKQAEVRVTQFSAYYPSSFCLV